jgi:hypothetical protein
MQQEFNAPPPPLAPQARGFRWDRVIAVLAVAFLILIIYPALLSAKRGAADGIAESNVRSIGVALIQYTTNHEDRYPDFSGDMVATLRPYLHDPKVIAGMNDLTWDEKLSGMRQQDLERSNDTWVLYGKVSGSSQWVVGFTDGHARTYAARSLQSILQDNAPKSRTGNSGRLSR